MQCEDARRRISVAVDGEGELPDGVNTHLDECADCRTWQEGVHRLKRTALHTAYEPDTELPTAAIPRPSGFLLYRSARISLGCIGALLIAWNIAGVVDAGADVDSTHLARHQAAFGVALGLALLFVALRPDRAYGMVPFAATFVIALSLPAVIDLARGMSTPLNELHHVAEIVGLAILLTLGLAAGPRSRYLRRETQATNPYSQTQPSDAAQQKGKP